MGYQFSAEVEQQIQAHLASGAYASADELLRNAMQALDQLEQEKLLRWHDRNRQADAQSQQRLSQPLDEARLLARLRDRLAAAHCQS